MLQSLRRHSDADGAYDVYFLHPSNGTIRAWWCGPTSSEIEVYASAMHRWCPPDSAVYNHHKAEKAWAGSSLRRP